jgi:hypothetical protein
MAQKYIWSLSKLSFAIIQSYRYSDERFPDNTTIPFRLLDLLRQYSFPGANISEVVRPEKYFWDSLVAALYAERIPGIFNMTQRFKNKLSDMFVHWLKTLACKYPLHTYLFNGALVIARA